MQQSKWIVLFLFCLALLPVARSSAQVDYDSFKIPYNHTYESIDIGTSFGPIYKRTPWLSTVILHRRFAFSARLSDPWFATKDSGAGLSLNLIERPNSYEEMLGMFRTGYFHVTDSVICGAGLRAHFFVDTAGGFSSDLLLTASYRLMDSATDSVVRVLTELDLAYHSPLISRRGYSVLSVPTGTYYLQYAIICDSIPDGADFERDSISFEGGHGGGFADSIYRFIFVNPNLPSSWGPVSHVSQGFSERRSLNMKLSPNPTSSTTVLTMNAEHVGEYIIDITDMVGRSVGLTTDISIHRTGTVEIPLDLSHIARGRYLVSVRSLDSGEQSWGTVVVE